jgi:hypothetical protein
MFAMTDLDYPNCQFIILNGINNSVSSLSQPISIMAGQFFAAWWTRVFRKSANFCDDFCQVFFGDGFEVFLNGLFEK